jgi:hypothetical protein
MLLELQAQVMAVTRVNEASRSRRRVRYDRAIGVPLSDGMHSPATIAVDADRMAIGKMRLDGTRIRYSWSRWVRSRWNGNSSEAPGSSARPGTAACTMPYWGDSNAWYKADIVGGQINKLQ